MQKIKDFFWGTILIIIIGTLFYKIIRKPLTDYLLQNNAVQTKAIIIDDKNYLPNQHVEFDFTYSYRFIINGKGYTNDSHDINAKIGDTVEIEYVKGWPSLNKPVHPF